MLWDSIMSARQFCVVAGVPANVINAVSSTLLRQRHALHQQTDALCNTGRACAACRTTDASHPRRHGFAPAAAPTTPHAASATIPRYQQPLRCMCIDAPVHNHHQ